MNGPKKEAWPTPGAGTRPTADGPGGRTLHLYLSGGQDDDGQGLALPVSDDWGRGRGLRDRHRRRRRVDESAERVWSSPEPQRISLFVCSITTTITL